MRYENQIRSNIPLSRMSKLHRADALPAWPEPDALNPASGLGLALEGLTYVTYATYVTCARQSLSEAPTTGPPLPFALPYDRSARRSTSATVGGRTGGCLNQKLV
jgi:hypothetical protein